MLHMFHTHVASICLKCFICFKCMLHLSVSCCKCRLLVLVSMRAGRAKPWPPTRGWGASVPPRYGEEAQAARCCCRRDGGESSERPGKDGRRANVEEAGASHPMSVGSGSETGSSDASTENGVGACSAQIQVDGAEKPRASRHPGASAAETFMDTETTATLHHSIFKRLCKIRNRKFK
jgi:hypothetical protein